MTVPASGQPPWRGRLVLASLVGAEAISNIGTRMSLFAIPWLVLVTTGNPVKTGVVAGFESLAYVVSGVLAAPLQDRVGARLTSVGSDVISVGVMVAIAVFGRLDFVVLVALVALMGMMRSQGDRAKVTILVPLMGSAGDYARVASIRDGVLRTSGLIGSSVAGIAIAFLGAIGAVWLDAVSFAAAAVLTVIAVPRVEAPAPAADPPTPEAPATATPAPAHATVPGEKPGRTGKGTDESYLSALRTGFTWFRGNRLLRAITGMLFFTSLFNQAATVVFVPLWVLTHMNDPKALGAISTAYAIGLIVGSAIFAGLSPVLPRYGVLVAGYIIGCAPRFLVLALSDSLPVVVAVTLFCGMAMCSAGPTVTATIAKRTPKEMLSRAGGIITAVAFGGLPLGGVIGGLLVATLGLTNGLLVIAALFFMVTLIPVARYGLWRELNDTAPPRPTADNGVTVHRLYGSGAMLTGVRLDLRYAHGRWSVMLRQGPRTVVPRQAVEAKVAAAALNGLNAEPVFSALRDVFRQDREYLSLRAQRTRAQIGPAEVRLAALSMIINADR